MPEEIMTASFNVRVKDVTEDAMHRLQKELNELLMHYQENGHDVAISLVYY